MHDPELLTLFPAAKALVPKLVYDMHEYVPEAVAGKPYIPSKVRPAASQTTAVAQKSLAALGSGVVVVTDDQLAALGSAPRLRLVLPNYPRVERFEGAEPVPELAADARLKLIYVGSLSRARGCTMMLDVMEQLEPMRPCSTSAARSTIRRSRRRRARGSPPASPTGSSCWAASRRRSCPGTWPRPTWSGCPRSRTASTATRRSRPSSSRAWRRGSPRWSATCRGAASSSGSRNAASPWNPAWRVTSAASGACSPTAQELPEMGARGRRAVERRYSWEAVQGDLVDFYGSLCAGLA